ncbi:peptide-methionine (R)-S-oxide reductase MsrB [uncultured Flavobacterium sp.]|uniref:peptide-methionine (R)-S-oxide reductase MsrB n=1 Tax=uncultured Flavobacterium sp. TaxID=165435 RepID=UPI0030CA56F6|tara:strand:- start:953 stop:1420 length:468 start_codon:yes stop_codon:yes gene_type:complete
MKKIIVILIIIIFQSCQSQKKEEKKLEIGTTETDWKKKLTSLQYEVLREKGTERAFSGEYWDHFEKGNYVCVACENVLFTSESKFESDCGWPSFDQAKKGAVTYHEDYSFGMLRTEVVCAKCDGHLGHIFDDGPKETTGKRFCTNSVSIKFKPLK